MAVAKLFWSGNSQALRLPKEMRLPREVSELEIRKEGEKLILEPMRPKAFGDDFFSVLGSLPEFKRPSQSKTRRKRLFP